MSDGQELPAKPLPGDRRRLTRQQPQRKELGESIASLLNPRTRLPFRREAGKQGHFSAETWKVDACGAVTTQVWVTFGMEVF